jgi:predicted nucleic acid-binding protein
LDTNVISETIKPTPEPKVLRWLTSLDERLFYVSVLTIGETGKGATCLPSSLRCAQLEAWPDDDVVIRFHKRILAIDQAIADRWGRISAIAKRAGTPMPSVDSLLAATALHHNLTFVTRDTSKLSVTGVPLFNPWQD